MSNKIDDFNSDFFYSEFPKYLLAPANLLQLNHEYLLNKLKYINQINSSIKIEEVGQSIEQRSLNMLSFGKGKTKILLWSQMHGDEPTATAAILAIYNYFAENYNTKFIQYLDENLQIYTLIMLNPDGTERFQRRNMQDIDINRDARLLQSPEGLTLKKMQERIKPDYGFNLHDIVDRKMVGDSKELLTIALMAPPYNKNNEDNLCRIKAKKVVITIKSVLDKYIKDHICRYKADFMPRAFGDSMQNWGVSTVLIESGTFAGDDPHYVVRMNFIALMAAFHTITTGKVDKAEENNYDDIPLEGIEIFDLLIKNVKILNGKNMSPFKGDIGIKVDNLIRDAQPSTRGIIQNIGDLSITTGIKVIEGENLIATPGFIAYISDSDSGKQVFKQGITSVLSDSVKNIPHLPEDCKISYDKIPDYTSIPAEILKIDNLGSIKINNRADLIIFSMEKEKVLTLDHIVYVIKNGEIVYNKFNN